MSFDDELERLRSRFASLDVSKVKVIWEDFMSGRPVEDKSFLIELEWQNSVRDEIRRVLDNHNSNSPTRIFFLVGEPGASKSQILSELVSLLRNRLNIFAVYHACYDYKKPEYINNSIIERKNEIYEQQDMAKKNVLDNLSTKLEIPALIKNLETLSRSFSGGVVILIDEIDYVEDTELGDWVNFFVSVNDRLKRGILIFVAIMRKKLEKILDDERVYRFVDDLTGKGILEVDGTYRSNDIPRVFAHFIALYERAFGLKFDRSSLRFVKRITSYLKDSISEGTTIRRANSIIMGIIQLMAQILESDQNFFSNIYSLQSQISSGVASTRLGSKCEEGLKLFLEETSFKIKLEGELNEIVFKGERMQIPLENNVKYVSDGSILVLRTEGDEKTEVLKLPFEVKFVGKNEKIPDEGVKKIISVNRARGIVLFILGFYNESEIISQFRGLLEDQIITIPGEIALLLTILATETRERMRRMLKRMLKLIINIDRRIKPYIITQYDYIKLKPIIQRVIAEMPTLEAPYQQTEIEKRLKEAKEDNKSEVIEREGETKILAKERASRKVMILAGIIKRSFEGKKKRTIGTLIKLITEEAHIGDKELAIRILRHLVEKRIFNKPKGWRDKQYISIRSSNLSREDIISALLEIEDDIK